MTTRKIIHSVFCLFILFLSTMPVFAAQTIIAKDNSTIRAVISNQSATRISVDNDRISIIRGVENAYTYSNDNTQGAVFIKPTDDYQKKPFYIFISTEQGHNYVLVLTPKPAAAGMLIIQSKESQIAQAAAWEKSLPYEDALTQLMTSMTTHSALEGYAITEIDKAKTIRLNKQLRSKLIAVFSGAELQGEIYLVTNHSAQPITLSERSFYQADVRAIALQTTELPPHGKTLLFKVTSHG